MYIDFIKEDYSNKTDEERKVYIERDKKALEAIIREKIAGQARDIVDRWYQLTDIGFIKQDEKFLDLLREAEQLYCFGFYTGAIAVVGIACEEYCKQLIFEHNICDKDRQELRINLLYKNKIIDDDIRNALHSIRKIRNNCMHYNPSFKKLNETELAQRAFEMIAQYKICLKPLSSEFDDRAEEDVFSQYAAEKNKCLREYLYKHRNILSKTKGINLQIDPKTKQMCQSSIYYIDEVDISDGFKEMTLVDLNNPFPVIVDLTLPQSDLIQSLGLKKGNLIVATIVSSPSCIGQTEEWLLLKIEDTFQIEFTLDEIIEFLIERRIL